MRRDPVLGWRGSDNVGDVGIHRLHARPHPFKAKKTGTLELTSHNQFDWAMEVRDAKGNVVAGTDGSDLTTPENMTVFLKKGKYEVVYCSFLGEPE